MFYQFRPQHALFVDRTDAGERLAQKLTSYADRCDVIVLGLPRGGVPVAAAVAKELHLPLDIFLVRKLGVPGHEELAMGAIASGGVRVLNDDVVDGLNIPQAVIERVAASEEEELHRRAALYRNGRPIPPLNAQTVILVDDGLATGASMHAAVMGLRAQGPRQIIVAVPVAAPETCEQFEDLVDELICAETPQPFFGVGYWYANFGQTTDSEVRVLLAAAQPAPSSVPEGVTP